MTIFHVIKYPVDGDTRLKELPYWVAKSFRTWTETFNVQPDHFGIRIGKVRQLLLEYDPDVHDLEQL